MINLQNSTNLDGLINQLQTAAGNSTSGPASSLFGNFSMSSLVIGLFAGLVGSAYFLYGKRQGNLPLLFAGLALWVVPLFISSVLWLSLSCGALIIAPLLFVWYL